MEPNYRRTRREALTAVGLWLLAGSWVVGGSYAVYDADPAGVVMGVPAWAFWSILTPWLVFLVVAAWYGLAFLGDGVER
ncbi:MAG: DUF997 family protein [Acidobacteria bacterium]|nr:DUF997 family protein [Acidobacteriota bacterium]